MENGLLHEKCVETVDNGFWFGYIKLSLGY